VTEWLNPVETIVEVTLAGRSFIGLIVSSSDTGRRRLKILPKNALLTCLFIHSTWESYDCNTR